MGELFSPYYLQILATALRRKVAGLKSFRLFYDFAVMFLRA